MVFATMAWGGRRVGAGRPAGATLPGREVRAQAHAQLADILGTSRDPLLVLLDLATDLDQPAPLRLEAAAVAVKFCHPALSAAAIQHISKPADGGAAVQVLLDRLAALAPPPMPAIAVSSGPTIEAMAEPEKVAR